MKAVVVGLVLGFFVVGVVAGVAIANRGDNEPTAATSISVTSNCQYRAGWQKLADKVRAPVYCPAWLPTPLTAQIGGPWNNINSVDRDRSYLIGFIWQENVALNTQEVHVNLRGYPRNTRIPTCQDVTTVAGVTHRKNIPCFQDPRGKVRSATGTVATMYTVNHGADTWHVLLAWRRNGSLYSLSEHVAEPYSYKQVVTNLKEMFDRLVLVQPRA